MNRKEKKQKKIENYKSIVKKADFFIRVNNNTISHLDEQERLLEMLYEDYTILKNKKNKIDIHPFERKKRKLDEQFLKLKNLYSEKRDSLETELSRPLIHYKSIF